MWANFSNLLDSLRDCMELVNFIKIRMSRDYVKLAELNWIIRGQNELSLTYLGRVDFIQVWKKGRKKRCFCSLLLFNISHSKRERGGEEKGENGVVMDEAETGYRRQGNGGVTCAQEGRRTGFGVVGETLTCPHSTTRTPLPLLSTVASARVQWPPRLSSNVRGSEQCSLGSNCDQ